MNGLRNAIPGKTRSMQNPRSAFACTCPPDSPWPIVFSDNSNRINITHTRCRKELYIVGGLECLKRGAGSGIFDQMERAFRRDDIPLTELELKPMQLGIAWDFRERHWDKFYE